MFYKPLVEMSSHKSIKLLTLNTWGLKYVSKLRKERLSAIAHRLANPSNSDEEYDIVALQEVWCEEDWIYLDESVANIFPYRRIFKSGILTGPGLAILSKIPIDETFLYRFPINGRASAFFRGDWLVGKSIAVTCLKPHEEGALPIAILNSHMHAPYAQSGDAAYSCHRACQAWDFTKIVRMLKKAGYAVVQVGDLNSKPGSLPYKLFTVESGLVDSWVNSHGEDDKVYTNQEIAHLSAREQIFLGGITCDSKLNTWRAHRESWEACRLDYALIDSENIKAVSAAVCFTETLPAPLNCSYSDHFAYSTELVIRKYETAKQHPEDREEVYKELLLELAQYRKHTIPFQATWRKYHFFTSVIVVIGLHVTIGFTAGIAPWIGVVVMFFSTIIGITGVLNGLIWGLAVRSELRALQEVQMEIEDSYASLKKNRVD